MVPKASQDSSFGWWRASFFSTLPRFWRVRIRKSLSRQKVSPLVVNTIYVSNLEFSSRIEWKNEQNVNPFVTLEYF